MVTVTRIVFLLLAAVCSFSASAAYAEMTIDGVTIKNGQWVTEAIVETTGVVRTTGALTVAGETTSTAVALRASLPLATEALLNTAARLSPYAMTAYGAYEVYDWLTEENDVQPCPDNQQWCTSPDLSNYDQSYTYGYFWESCSSGCAFGYNKTEVCTKLANYYGLALGSVSDTCNFVSRTTGQPVRSEPLAIRKCVPSDTFISCTQPIDPNRPQAVPLDWSTVHLGDPDWNTLSDGYKNLPELRDQGVPLTGVDFTPYSEWKGDPYFKDGNWYRDRMDISPAPTTSSPTRVRVDIGPIKLQGYTDPNTKPPQVPASGSTAPKEQSKFCDDNPKSVVCQEFELGELEADPMTPEERPVDVSYSPWGASNAGCPAPKVIPLWEGHSVSVTYKPVCDFASLLRPLVIALAFVAAGFIVAGMTRKSGGDS